MALHDRIKEARKNAGMTQAELGEKIGVAKTTVAGYEKNREPTAAQLGEIADALGVDVTFLLQDEVKRRYASSATLHEMEHLVKRYRSLDPYGKEAVDCILDVEYRRCQKDAPDEAEEIKTLRFRVPEYTLPMSAGTGEESGLEFPEDIELVRKPPRGTSYIAHVSGDSMEPDFHDGDMVFVHACEGIQVGKIGVFLMDGRQWVKELGDGILISHNLEYAPIPMREDIRCQGLVLGVCDESYFE